MMKKNLLLLFLAISLSIIAQDRSIEFRQLTFDEALKASTEESKPIFMDAYTTWCGPCKWMSANIFTQNEVADYYNENFVCVKFDMEKGEGLDIAKEFSIRAYPTLIFVDGDRNLVMKSIGASRNNQDYIDLGANARSEDFNLISLAENVSKNRENAEFMSKYFDIMAGADMVDQEEVTIYFSAVPKEQWSSEDNWKIIMRVVEDIEGVVFQDLLSNTESYRAVNGEIVDQFITYKIQNALMTKIYSRDADAGKQYVALLEKVETWEFAGKDNVIFSAESTRMKRQSPEDYQNFMLANVEKYIWDDANQLNAVAWFFFENVDDTTALKNAEDWAARAVELNPSHQIMDTYANLLYANGKYSEALEVETNALNMAKEEGADTSSYEEVIETINEALKG